MLQVKEVLAVSEVVELLGAGAHDRDHELVLELGIQHANALCPLHTSGSSISSRVSSSATGESELWDSSQPSRIWRPTSFGLLAYSNGMFNARSTPSVTMPPRVCQGCGSPQCPRSAISMHNGMPYSIASDTMPLIAARKPWFC